MSAAVRPLIGWGSTGAGAASRVARQVNGNDNSIEREVNMSATPNESPIDLKSAYAAVSATYLGTNLDIHEVCRSSA